MADGNKANKIAGIALVLMALGVAGVLVMARSSTTTAIHACFDNGLDGAVRIEADGKELVALKAHTAAEAPLEVGKHKIRVLDDKGKTVEEVDIDVPAAQGMTEHTWAYDVSRKNHYKVVYLAYGNASPEPSATVGDKAQFFEMPSPRAVFLPAQAAAEKGRAGTTLPVVTHDPVHADWPCCANARALIETSKRGK